MLLARRAAIALGLLGLLSLLLQRLGIGFVFAVGPWYGPLLAGTALAALAGSFASDRQHALTTEKKRTPLASTAGTRSA